MDYVEVLSTWAMRHGVAAPQYKQTYKMTDCVFLNRKYSVDTMGRYGLQEAAQRAYEHSGVFGNVRQVGFVPDVFVLDEVLMDFARFYPDTAPLAMKDALSKYPEAQITIFAPYNDTQVEQIQSNCAYTVYSTVHPTDEALWARIEWYTLSRMQTWTKYDTHIHLYSNDQYGQKIKDFLEGHGLVVTLE